jgi:putative endonuclease
LTDKIKIGNKGEELAARFLSNSGYRIIERNWRFKRAEIDIVCMDGETMVFIEVKTRSSDYYGEPEEFVNDKKEKLLFDAANAYMELSQHEWAIRFDIIAILLHGDKSTVTKHIKDAFFSGI